MRYFGFFFKDRDEEDNLIVDNQGTIVKYKLLHVIEFNSDRKRMSVVVRTEDNRIMIICKGADSIINARLAPGQKHIQKCNQDLESYAEVGLRTLLIACKYIDNDFYDKWVLKFKDAETSLMDRDTKIADCAEEVEYDFELVGCSAIEDKLQDEVGPTIRDFRTAGVKVWVLTGDKVETAINIGQSCQLLSKEQNWLALKGSDARSLKREVNELMGKQNITARYSAVIVDGFQLSIIQSDKELEVDFVNLCTHEKCQVVLVCRVSPQ
jgi:magnesium-transporting ATPase (P-type)